MSTTAIRCERCGRTTADPDRWDPDVNTGLIFCDNCWDHRSDTDEHVAHVELGSGDGRYYVWCEDCDFDAGRTPIASEAEDWAQHHRSDPAWLGASASR